ncbi:hypothetical protein TPR58_19935 [Sphingomonas sp. HF-S3]|uniref:Uncharacterized protein n=1 Tax=Sphingomonas rustica TaxID=3103142 RepID=A0ABV0BFQ1_9SPHN
MGNTVRARRGVAVAVIAAFAVAAAGRAQVVVLNGRSAIGSDSSAGQLVTIVSANSGGARVSIRTDPEVALICDQKAPVTRCSAWVRTGARIRVEMRRPDSPRVPPGHGAAPTREQWGRGGCPGTLAGADCTVVMSAARTVAVDWSR